MNSRELNMVTTHSLGFPRIGKQRELKFALEDYWKGDIDSSLLKDKAELIQKENWQHQSVCDWVPVGDFSYYDHVLDMSFLLGNIPERIKNLQDPSELNNYFRLARGCALSGVHVDKKVNAAEMTKWFNTNYHYIVPEFTSQTQFELNPSRLLQCIKKAKETNVNCKPVIIGPVTYLWLGKVKNGPDNLAHLDELLTVYRQLLDLLSNHGIEWVQIDEPILVTELSVEWKNAIEKSYYRLQNTKIKLLLTTYFGSLKENLQLACQLPVAGLHIDAITHSPEVQQVIDRLPAYKILSLGVVDGRNVWKSDLNNILDWLEPIHAQLGDRLWIAPSCSLLHVPVDLSLEDHIDADIKQWLAFSLQKLDELTLLQSAINNGRNSVKAALEANAAAINSKKMSERVHNKAIKEAVNSISPRLGKRVSHYNERRILQKQTLALPIFPTTTIGSFPQTATIRKSRHLFKQGKLSNEEYVQIMRQAIYRSIVEQEKMGIDVLVHGEAERNDMVEYFSEQLDGFVSSEYAWVQSYGSRCVKPPIIYGDISRSKSMTIDWILYAQSLTEKPVKGMLTGPVTLLNWSFVRDDQSRKDTCYQLALAVREEVLDLEKAGIHIIQVDEPALREGLPLRQSEWKSYLDWSVESFRISANGVQDETQIHTHMCYSDFNNIITSIADMDADVITIETSRSDMKLLDIFEDYDYPNDIGPGVYDIHSPNTPDVEQIVKMMNKAAERIPRDKLWINPDCGLKTRRWEEVIPALTNMVKAADILRKMATSHSLAG